MRVPVDHACWAETAAFLDHSDRRQLLALCKASVESQVRRDFFAQSTWRVPTDGRVASRVLKTMTMKRVVKCVRTESSWQQVYLDEFPALESLEIVDNPDECGAVLSASLPVRLKKVDVKRKNVGSLKALTRLENLEELSLYADVMYDASALQELQRLIKLTIKSCPLDVRNGECTADWIGSLVNLRSLHTWHPQLVDRSLISLIHLEELMICTWCDVDLDILTALAPRLTRLDMAEEPITGAPPRQETDRCLASLVKMENLRIGGDNFIYGKLDALSGLDSIRILYLFLDGIEIDDLGPLATLVDLEELTVSAPNTDWSPIASCKELRMVDLQATEYQKNCSAMKALYELPLLITLKNPFRLMKQYPLEHVTVMEASRDHGEFEFEEGCCPNVDKLILDGTFVMSNIVASFPKLRHLELSGDSATVDADIRSLACLTRLETLVWPQNCASCCGFAFLGELTRLQHLDLTRDPIADISMLGQLRELRSLKLKRTLVRDITLLAGLKRLERLDLSLSRVRDVSCLYGHPQLRWLRIPTEADCGPLVKEYGVGLPNIVRIVHGAERNCIWHHWLGVHR